MVDSERPLVDRARSGDQDAFRDLVNAHRGQVWAVCLRITGNIQDAEDALQETLTAAWQNMQQFRGDARFSTWLFRIAANAALAVVRKRVPLADADVDTPAPQRDFGDRIADAHNVQAALMAIPEVFRVALVLRVYGDLTYRDIAIHQGVPVQTVKSRISRARTMIEDLLTADQVD